VIERCLLAACAMVMACAGLRSASADSSDSIKIGVPFARPGRLVVPVPKGWIVQEIYAVGFEGEIYDLGPKGERRCGGAMLIDSGGFGLGQCGAATPSDRAGSLFGIPVTWKVGPVPMGRCGEMLWARALLPGTPDAGIQLFARSREQMDALMDLASKMRVEGGTFKPAPPDSEDRSSFTPELCLPSNPAHRP